METRMTTPALALRIPLLERLRAAVIEGVLAPGSPIGESATAERLGVSRTPVREALLQLEREGLVTSRKDHGFRVAGLSVRELDELYPLIGCLERFAVEHGTFTASSVRDLRALNGRIARSGDDTRARVRLDGELHARLTSACSNLRLQDEVERLRGAARRYEFVYGRASTLERSVAEHARVIARIASGKVREAGRFLEQHTLDSLPELRHRVEALERDPLH
jgi:DNA-binding GntR family transcriptional regulator